MGFRAFAGRIRPWLFEDQPAWDLGMSFGVGLALLLVLVAASWIPMRQAMAVSPGEILGDE